jgi:hypothetical protein
MPHNIVPNSGGRVDISAGLSKSEAKAIAANKSVTVVQFASPLLERDFDYLNEYVFSTRPDILFRAYAHYSQECDLSFLKKFSHLKKFSADCIINVKNEDCLSVLENVEELSVAIYGLTSFDFLKDINKHLKKLTIGGTFSKKPSLSLLSRFKELQHLFIEGTSKGIEALGDLCNLETIILRSISTDNLNFLINLKKLWSIDIKLGGISNFSVLRNLTGIKYLELWQINKLADISFISEMPDLQNLFIQSLRNIEALPNFSANLNLRRIYLENMKGLKDVSSLSDAPALEEFIYVSAQNLQPKDFTGIIENENIKQLLIRFGSITKNDKLDDMIKKSGKQLYTYHDFIYA